jgi:hypothetical protein
MFRRLLRHCWKLNPSDAYSCESEGVIEFSTKDRLQYLLSANVHVGGTL